MSPHTLILLLTSTLFGVNYCQLNCSFDNLFNNLTFPDTHIRPVKNWTTVTEINIGMILYTIVKLDTSLQSLTTLVWFSMTWKNEFLQWDPKRYCSIEQILLSDDNIWKPDMYIYERIEGEDKSSVMPFYILNHDGVIKSAVPLRIVSSCKLDILKFPFDTQKCNLTFGPYIHSVKDIIMINQSNSAEVLRKSLAIFVSKGDWNLLDITVAKNPVKANEIAYSSIYYEITLKRVAVVYILTLIAPACLMIFLDIASMFIQMESGERLAFKITIVLGFSVLLLILNSMLPTSNVPPILGIFCCVCMAVMVISIMGCIAISYMITLSETQPTVPSWIKSWILGYLARVVCFKGKSFMKYGINISEAETHDNKRVLGEETKRKKSVKEDCIEVKLLKKLLLEILKIHTEIINSREKDDIKTEWHAAALVVDRLVLIIYLLIVVILFAAVLIIWLI
ncbi:5-hydroxytryptamine receptor 3A-like [Rhinoderma darwinii]|uniref:5-hydroxytryptamine receptor 3A-like n=1 Tax=Rhinoderma darwinii TaxID=43563 RepID=UPI003F663C41